MGESDTEYVTNDSKRNREKWMFCKDEDAQERMKKS